jgi:hypothetical protein
LGSNKFQHSEKIPIASSLTFDSPGYELIFIQKCPCRDETAHEFSLIYKFFSEKTKYWYIVNADYHTEHVFAIKFYCKKDRKSDFKYSKIVNKGDVGNILITCAKLVPRILIDYPNASFVFAASRSVDSKNKMVEPYVMNQRFGTYKYLAANKFGAITFTHFEYPEISCYLMVNNKNDNVSKTERTIVKMLTKTYPNILNLTSNL